MTGQGIFSPDTIRPYEGDRGWRGIVDFEDGVIDAGESKPAFPSKGIYPNKNMEKSKLFYGVRGVRQIAALFKTRVDERYPRANLTFIPLRSSETATMKGIYYLAICDNYDRIEWYRTVNHGDNWQLVTYYTGNGCPPERSGERYTAYGTLRTGYSYYDGNRYTANYFKDIESVHKVDFYLPKLTYPHITKTGEEIVIVSCGDLPCNIPMGGYISCMPPESDISDWSTYSTLTDSVGIMCRVYKGNVWAESDIIYANGRIEKNPSPKLTPPIISVQFVPYQRNCAVKELKPPTINLSLETDTAFTRTEEIAPLSLSLALESPQITRAVLELRPPLISLEVEAVEGITRTEGHRTKPEITVNYSTVADVQLSSIAIMSEPLIIGVDGGKTETVTVLNYAPTPELSVSITREDAVGTVAVPIYPEPLIIGVDGGKTETVTVLNYAPTPELSVSITREDAVGTVAVPIYPEPLIIGVDGGKTETVTVSQVTA